MYWSEYYLSKKAVLFINIIVLFHALTKMYSIYNGVCTVNCYHVIAFI